MADAGTAYGIALCRNRRHEMLPRNTYLAPRGGVRCRACARTTDAARHERHWEGRNKRKQAAYNAKYKDQRRPRNLAKFGLTVESFDVLLATQGGVCAICGTDEPGGRWKTNFMVDHDHKMGCVRGLLCAHCNVMLGNAADDPARLRAAADYLERGR